MANPVSCQFYRLLSWQLMDLSSGGEGGAQITKIPQSLVLNHVANRVCNSCLQVYITGEMSAIRQQSTVERYTAGKPRQVPNRAESCTTWSLKLRSPQCRGGSLRFMFSRLWYRSQIRCGLESKGSQWFGRRIGFLPLMFQNGMLLVLCSSFDQFLQANVAVGPNCSLRL